MDLKESREGWFRRGRGRSFPVETPKTERAREATVKDSGTRNPEEPGGTRRLKALETEARCHAALRTFA